MIRILVEVASGATHFRADVTAKNIERAVALAAAQYPSSQVRVVFPIEPETFFAEGASPVTEQIQLQVPEVKAS
jgi:hypothetical protein